jgi:hypothetical protein
MAPATAKRTGVVEHAALLKEARKAAANAYAKYSGFHVGAAVLTAAGNIYSGCNVWRMFPIRWEPAPKLPLSQRRDQPKEHP